jgi:hypothetical protein
MPITQRNFLVPLPGSLPISHRTKQEIAPIYALCVNIFFFLFWLVSYAV